MIIAPKLDTQHHAIPSYITTVYEGAVEVQMLTLNFAAEATSIRQLVDVLPPTNVLLVHLPFGAHDLSLYLMSERFRMRLLGLMSAMNYVQDTRIIMHVSTPWSVLAMSSWDAMLQELYTASGGRVTFLFENEMINPNRHNLQIPDVATFLDVAASEPYIRGLVDLTHLNASKSCTKETVWYPDTARDAVDAYHIAAAIDGDGWYRKGTHGRRHKNYNHLQADMDALKETFSIRDDTVLVTEVTEEDYSGRPEQYQEILWLRRYREEA